MRDPLDGFEWETGWTWSRFGFRKITLSVEGVDRTAPGSLWEGCVLCDSRPREILGQKTP